MTEFLQRLAERAMGVRQLARAVSLAPFAPAPPLVEDTDAVALRTAVHGQLASGRVAHTTRATPAQPRTLQAGQPVSGTMAHTTTGQGVGEVSGQRLPQAPAAAEPLIGLARAAPPLAHPVAARDRAARLPRQASLEMIAAQSADLLAMMATPPELLPDSLAPNATADAAPRPSVATEPDAETVRRQEPGRVMPTLLPPTPDTSQTFRPGGAVLDRPNATHTGAIEETTEVHIHIGRIEVTAMHEPAPAKPAAARRTAPMSLDDYLAKRHGGRP